MPGLCEAEFGRTWAGLERGDIRRGPDLRWLAVSDRAHGVGAIGHKRPPPFTNAVAPTKTSPVASTRDKFIQLPARGSCVPYG